MEIQARKIFLIKKNILKNISFFRKNCCFFFRKFLQWDVRHVIATADNELRYTYGGRPRSLNYHPLLKPLLFRSIIDPAPYLRQGYARENLCVLCAVIISLCSRLGKNLQKFTISKMESVIEILETTGLFRLEEAGLGLTQFSKFEILNRPIPDALVRLFPQLSYYQGFSLNLFRVRRMQNCFRIFPISLSQHNRKSDFFQIDMIQVSDDLLQVPVSQSDTNHHLKGHVLAVPFLSKLITKFHRSKKANWSKFIFLCRSCMSTFKSVASKDQHYLICPGDIRKGSVAFRKGSQNQFIHQPFILNHFTQKPQRNGLHWLRKNNHRMLRPLLLCWADLESYSSTVPPHAFTSGINKVPSTAVRQQKSMSWSYCFTGLYRQFPLPASLNTPRVKFCRQDGVSNEQSLYIAFLLSLRGDLVKHLEFLQSVLQHDQGPTPPKQRNPTLLKHFRNILYCCLCGAKFGQKKFSAVSRKFYYVTRTFDHNHYSLNAGFPALSSNLRSVLCQGCNLAASCKRYLARNPLIVYFHNGNLNSFLMIFFGDEYCPSSFTVLFLSFFPIFFSYELRLPVRFKGVFDVGTPIHN